MTAPESSNAPTPETSSASTESSAAAHRVDWRPLLLVTPLAWFLDQASKFWAVKRLTRALVNAPDTLAGQLSAWLDEHHLSRAGLALPPRAIEPVLPSFWSWRYAENPGAAWSFAADWPLQVRQLFFPAVSLVALYMIVSYYRKLLPTQRMLQVALAFVMGGALGNLTDRLIRGYVIDFVDWHLNDPYWMRPTAHWPTFNVADVCIDVGVGLIALDALITWWRQRRQPAAPVSSRETTDTTAA